MPAHQLPQHPTSPAKGAGLQPPHSRPGTEAHQAQHVATGHTLAQSHCPLSGLSRFPEQTPQAPEWEGQLLLGMGQTLTLQDLVLGWSPSLAPRPAHKGELLGWPVGAPLDTLVLST